MLFQIYLNRIYFRYEISHIVIALSYVIQGAKKTIFFEYVETI